MGYPKYYRKNGRCLKVLSADEALKVTLPPDYLVPLRTIVAGAARVADELRDFDEVDAGVWEDFNFTFRNQILEEKRMKERSRQAEFDPTKK